MSPLTLDYRNPSTPDGRRFVGALEHLRRRDRVVWISALAMIVCSVPLLLVAPAALGFCFWFTTFMWIGYYPYSWFFWGLAVLAIPSLFLGEAKQRGGFFVRGNLDVAAEIDDVAPPSVIPVNELGMFLSFIASPRTVAAFWNEFFLVGPRLMLDGLTKLRRARQLRDVSLDRAAELIVQLRASDRGIPTHTLLRENETMKQLVPVLCLLLFYDWIGVSKTGDRAWLLTDARSRLDR